MSFNAFSRRRVLQLMGATAALPLVTLPLRAQDNGVRAIVLSDLHSAYERMGQLLAAIEAEIAANPAQHVILINGDVFELGNVVAVRSEARADWAFLEMLAKLAPTVVNIGNHEPDIDNDLANFVTRAGEIGITVVSNITDMRTNALYAPSHVALEVGGQTINIAAIATNAATTYPKATRDMMAIPNPVEWATQNLGAQLQAGGINVVLSHAGVVADQQILPLLPDGTLIVGGHDHLRFIHEESATRYVHTGSWSSLMTIATLAAGAAPQLAQVEIDREAAPNAALAEIIAAVLTEHLTDEERASVGTAPEALSLGDTGRFVAATLAKATGADIGFIGHTTFGTGLPEGEVSLYDYNAVVRFEGKVMTAEVDAAVLKEILARCNQDGDLPLASRTGDFLYAAPAELEDKATYIIAANDWSFTNQKNYFGREDLVATEVAGLMVKPTVRAALQ